MKIFATTLWLCSSLLSICLAEKSKSNAVIFHTPLSLDINKEYSEADLKELYIEQTEMSFKQRNVESNVIKTPTNPQMSKAASEVENSKAWKPMDIQASASFGYTAVCWGGLKVIGMYNVRVRFDGKIAHWSNALHIDGFGYISITGNGNPYTSRADYHHVECFAPDSQTICSYYHFGILEADIYSQSKLQSIKFSAVQQSIHLDKWRQPRVIQTCNIIPKGVKKAPCPRPDSTVPANWCSVGQINMFPY